MTSVSSSATDRRHWLVLYVKSCMERKTAQRLAAMGIESYVPVQTVTRRWSDRLKKVEKLVLPLVVFVHVNHSERQLALTLGAATRYLVLRGQHEPAVIPDEQLRQFRFMLDYSPEAVGFSAEPLAPGDPIRVIKGPLAGLEGELVNLDGRQRVFVRLDLLGCAHVEVPVGFVEKCPPR